MFDFSKLKTLKTWRVYINNCPVSGYFDFNDFENASLLASQKGGRVVLEYLTILQN